MLGLVGGVSGQILQMTDTLSLANARRTRPQLGVVETGSQREPVEGALQKRGVAALCSVARPRGGLPMCRHRLRHRRHRCYRRRLLGVRPRPLGRNQLGHTIPPPLRRCRHDAATDDGGTLDSLAAFAALHRPHVPRPGRKPLDGRQRRQP